ncbi:MAG: hypothetical protein AAF657_11005 [Acidobacteriota bacterium]
MNLDQLGQREKRLLMVLALLLPILLWQTIGPMLQGFANRGSGGGRAAARVEQRAKARQNLDELRLASLNVESGEYEPQRNIFIYGQEKKPPPPPPVVRPPAVARAPRPVPAPRGPAKPQPPPIDLKLLGIFGPERQRIAVLTDDEGAIIDALEEDVVREKFIVHRIGYESIDLKFVGFPDVEPERVEIGG